MIPPDITTTIAEPEKTEYNSQSRPRPTININQSSSTTASSEEDQMQSPSVQRTQSEPSPSTPSTIPFPRRFTSGSKGDLDGPRSAGYAESTSTMSMGSDGRGDEKGGSSSANPTTAEQLKREKAKRRHSHENRVNVYTECGRHSDDWLFGGFSVGNAVKKIWEKKE